MEMVAQCRCGSTAFETQGAPMMTAVCYCESCRTAGRQFEKMSDSYLVIRDDGGTPYSLFRKDRITLLRGASNLQEHRLKAVSPTRRVIASCCNSPMFLDFTPGYWLSLYQDRLSEHAHQPVQRAHSTAFMFKLLMGWTSMGFRRPKPNF